jgi:hypothetical protein
VCVKISEEQRGLEKNEAGNPDSGRSAENREQLTASDRFNQKKQK